MSPRSLLEEQVFVPVCWTSRMSAAGAEFCFLRWTEKAFIPLETWV